MKLIRRGLSRKTAVLESCFPDWLQAYWKRWPEFGRYVFFGGVNTVLTYVIYLVCLRFMTYRMAYTVTFLSGILISYCFNARYVFKKELRMTKALQFAAVYLVQYFVGLGLLFTLVEVAHLSKVFAPVLLVFLIVPSNYWLNRLVLKDNFVADR